MEGIHALHTGHTIGTDLFLIGEDANGGVGRGLGLDLSHQCGVSVHTVIVAVAAHHGAVKTDVTALVSRGDLDLGPHELLLGDAVLLVEEDHGVQLDGFLDVLILHRIGTDEDVQLLGLDAVLQGAGVLLGAQMGQQVGDAEDGVALVLADADGDGGAVVAGEDAVDGQRHGAPLILADAAVVMGLEVAQVVGLIQRGRAQVQTGAVGMRDDQTEAVLKAAGADGGSHDGLLELDEVDLIAGLVGLFGVELHVAGILEHLLALGGDFALGLAVVEELLVALGKSVCLLLDVCILVGDVSRLIEQLFGQLLGRSFFCHRISPAFLFPYS